MLYGFAEHERRHDATWAPRPACGCATTSRPGTLELNGKSADLSRSAWVGAATRDFTDVDVAALDAELDAGGWAGRAADRAAAPGGTRRCCRRPRSPT